MDWRRGARHVQALLWNGVGDLIPNWRRIYVADCQSGLLLGEAGL